MKKIFLTLLLLLPFTLFAAKKPHQAVVNLISYKADGTLLASGYGFVLSSEGQTVVPYALLNGAYRAEVIDAKGKRYPVSRIVGASSTYDLAVVTLEAKKPKFDFFVVATDSVAVGEALQLYTYTTAKKAQPTVVEVKGATPYAGLHYYETTAPNELLNFGCPLLNNAGEVVGMVQRNVADSATTSCAIDVRFADRLKVTAVSAFNSDLRKIHLPKQLPASEEQALSYVLVLDPADSLLTLTAYQDFNKTFPQNPEGYLNLATFHTLYGHYDEAKSYVDSAFKVGEKKDEMHYAFSKLLYTYANSGATPYEDWGVKKAAAEAAVAYALNPLPLYLQHEALCHYLGGDFAQALKQFEAVGATDFATAETFYRASKCVEAMGGDTLRRIALLDSAIVRLPRPIAPRSAGYVMERANLLYEVGAYRKAVADYDMYEDIMGGNNLTDRFYALRSQVHLAARMYQQALDDIHLAIRRHPTHYYYQQECARIYLVVGQYDNAVTYAQKSLELHPDNPEAHRLLALALQKLGRDAEAQEHLKLAE
jgi:tetratricopeptide (TPR) repeat protein